jgi:hypothetical protein
VLDALPAGDPGPDVELLLAPARVVGDDDIDRLADGSSAV